MRPALVIPLVVSMAWSTSLAAADVHTGTQNAPPVHAGDPALPEQLDGRHAVRGCAVEDHCVRASDTLHEFEVEAFPKSGSGPWLDDRNPAPSHLEAHPTKRAKKPSDIRPEAKWMDNLELPDLPVTWSPKLLDYLTFYKDDPRGRAIMQSWLVAQGRYKDMISRYLRTAHLPADLLYVAMIESSYDNNDSSSAGALGLWQFMPEGGRIYGLREDHWVDERRDPLRSTIAVMDYWQDLYQRFGEWQIAMAAFNVGYGAMLRSVARYNTNDYYQLCDFENGLPWEACLYTPKVLAVAIVGHNRAAFGFDNVKELPTETWDEISVPASVALATIAQAAGVQEADIQRLNPQLRHGRTPPGETSYVVRVPTGTKASAQQHLVELESQWSGYDAYVMSHGERFEDVATQFGISVQQLRKLNDVKDETEIEGGTVVVVPRVSEADRAKNKQKARAKLLGSGIDAKDGEQLLVAIPDKDAVVEGKKRVFYRVVVGDSLKGVAKAFGVSTQDLIAWNGLDPEAKIHPRMVVMAWVAPSFDAAKKKVELLDEADLQIVTRGSDEHMDAAEQRTGRVRHEYVATGREKLEDVARRFGLKADDVARINQISPSTVLDKGQKIIVYEVSDPSRTARAEEQYRHTPRGNRNKASSTKPSGPVTKPAQIE